MSYSWLKPSYRKKTESVLSGVSGVKSEYGGAGDQRQSSSVSSVSDAIKKSSSKSKGGSSSRSSQGSIQETIEKSQGVSSKVTQHVEAPTETTSYEPDLSPTEQVSRPRDAIVVGPEDSLSSLPLTSREEVLEGRRRSSKDVPVSMPDMGTESIFDSRIVSPQETISVESEALRMEQERMGREIIELPTEQSRRLSESLVGPLENIPKSETAPRALAAAVEWGIMLPAETLKSPVTLTELGGELKERGVIITYDLPGPTEARMIGLDLAKAGKFTQEELITPIMKDPAGAGVKAGLTAGLLIAPVAAKVVRARVSQGAPGRTTPSYELVSPRETATPINVRYLSDITFEPIKGSRQGAIRGTGDVLVVGEAGEALVDVRSVTLPRGKGFRTDLEASKLSRSKMDLPTGENIRGSVFSEEISPKVTRTRGITKGEKIEGQLDLLGRPQPEEELIIARGRTTEITQDFDISVGSIRAQKSTLAMEPRKAVSVTGRKLLLEERAGDRIRRVTLSREALIEPGRVRDAYFRPEDLGFTQDTLRGFDKSDMLMLSRNTKQLAAAERAMQQAAQSYYKGKALRSPETRLSPASRTQPTQARGERPISGLGSLPLAKPRTIEESMEIVRYPPSEGPPELAQTTPNAPNMAMESGLSFDQAFGLGEVVRPGSRISRTSRTTMRQDFRMSMESDVRLGLEVNQRMLQRQQQQLRLELKLEQRQRQRTRFMIPDFFDIPGRSRAIGPFETLPRGTPGGGLLVPILPGGSRIPILESGGKAPKRRYQYLPTIAGIGSGVRIGAAPRGAVTGLEIRPPVKRRRL